MNLYPFETRGPKPEWYRRAMAQFGIDADKVNVFFLDDVSEEDWTVPAAYILKMPPNYILSRHGHACERFEVVVRGELHVGDGRVAKPGDVFTAKANTLYGPHTAGPEGCVTVEVFGRLDAMSTMLYEGSDGQILAADALKGEFPPDYVPTPDEMDVAL